MIHYLALHLISFCLFDLKVQFWFCLSLLIQILYFITYYEFSTYYAFLMSNPIMSFPFHISLPTFLILHLNMRPFLHLISSFQFWFLLCVFIFISLLGFDSMSHYVLLDLIRNFMYHCLLLNFLFVAHYRLCTAFWTRGFRFLCAFSFSHVLQLTSYILYISYFPASIWFLKSFIYTWVNCLSFSPQ